MYGADRLDRNITQGINAMESMEDIQRDTGLKTKPPSLILFVGQQIKIK